MRAAWRNTRITALDAQQGRCASDSCSSAARDVVLVAGHPVAFCRSCRLRFDAPDRTAKAHATRQIRRRVVEQVTIPGV